MRTSLSGILSFIHNHDMTIHNRHDPSMHRRPPRYVTLEGSTLGTTVINAQQADRTPRVFFPGADDRANPVGIAEVSTNPGFSEGWHPAALPPPVLPSREPSSVPVPVPASGPAEPGYVSQGRPLSMAVQHTRSSGES